MSRISLLAAAAAIAVLALGAAPGAAANSSSASAKACVTSSENVIGKSVLGSLSYEHVNSAQAVYASCGQAKKAMNRALGLRLEEPKSLAGYYCTPTVHSTVHSTSPDDVSYRCVFKGADTPMFVKVTFRVKYNLD